MEKIYKDLGIQIVLQAVTDYKRVLRQPDKKHKGFNRIELESFFRSKWCRELTSIDMVKAMEHIKREEGAE